MLGGKSESEAGSPRGDRRRTNSGDQKSMLLEQLGSCKRCFRLAEYQWNDRTLRLRQPDITRKSLRFGQRQANVFRFAFNQIESRYRSRPPRRPQAGRIDETTCPITKHLYDCFGGTHETAIKAQRF